MKIIPRIVQVTQKTPCMGLMVSTSNKTMMKDIPEVYSKIMKLKDENEINRRKLPWEYISLSTNYSGSSAWDYYTGYVINDESISNDIPCMTEIVMLLMTRISETSPVYMKPTNISFSVF